MKHLIGFVVTCFLNLSPFVSLQATVPIHPDTWEEVVIVGGGIIGAMESYYAHLDAVKQGKNMRVIVCEKGPFFSEHNPTDNTTNTACHIVPSLTPDEILSVVPRGPELVEKLAILFSDPGGIRVDDVPGANDSPSALGFKEAVELYGKDKNHEDRAHQLLRLGKMSMDLWQNLYEQADEELKAIFKESHYNPCHDPHHQDARALHEATALISFITSLQQRPSRNRCKQPIHNWVISNAGFYPPAKRSPLTPP